MLIKEMPEIYDFPRLMESKYGFIGKLNRIPMLEEFF